MAKTDANKANSSTKGSASKYHHPDATANRPSTRAVSYSKAAQAGLLAKPNFTSSQADSANQIQPSSSLSEYGFYSTPTKPPTGKGEALKKPVPAKKDLTPLSQMAPPNNKKRQQTEISGGTTSPAVPAKRAFIDDNAMDITPDGAGDHPASLPGAGDPQYVSSQDDDDDGDDHPGMALSQALATQGSISSASSSSSSKTQMTDEYAGYFDDGDFAIDEDDLPMEVIKGNIKGKGREYQPPAGAFADATPTATTKATPNEDVKPVIPKAALDEDNAQGIQRRWAMGMNQQNPDVTHWG